jgi:hypothetical protein
MPNPPEVLAGFFVRGRLFNSFENGICIQMRGNARGQAGARRYASGEGLHGKGRLSALRVTLQQAVTLFGSGAVSAFLCAGKLIGINRIGITLHLWHVTCMVPAAKQSTASLRHALPISFTNCGPPAKRISMAPSPILVGRRLLPALPKGTRAFFWAGQNKSRFSERAASTLCLML